MKKISMTVGLMALLIAFTGCAANPESETILKETSVEAENTEIAEDSEIAEEATQTEDAASSSKDLYEAFIAGEISAKYPGGNEAINITELDMTSGEYDSYKVGDRIDLDNDGEKELILEGPYGGMYIDKQGEELVVLACGGGYELSYMEYDNSVWIVYSDTSHQGREYYLFEKYDGNSTPVDQFDLSAEFYDENITYTYRGQEISKMEYIRLCLDIFADDACMEAYQQKVYEYLQNYLYEDLKFDLVYINDDMIPELLVDKCDYWVSVYTYGDGQIYPVLEQEAYGTWGRTYSYKYKTGIIMTDCHDATQEDVFEGEIELYRMMPDYSLKTEGIYNTILSVDGSKDECYKDGKLISKEEYATVANDVYIRLAGQLCASDLFGVDKSTLVNDIGYEISGDDVIYQGVTYHDLYYCALQGNPPCGVDHFIQQVILLVLAKSDVGVTIRRDATMEEIRQMEAGGGEYINMPIDDEICIHPKYMELCEEFGAPAKWRVDIRSVDGVDESYLFNEHFVLRELKRWHLGMDPDVIVTYPESAIQ